MKNKILRANKWHDWMQKQLVARGISDQRVLQAIADVPRGLFVSKSVAPLAEMDAPLEIGACQTVSQPYVVALGLEAVALKAHEKVLEVGAGSGWQSALLGKLCREVHAVEIRSSLLVGARLNLANLSCDNVHLHLADGRHGWQASAGYNVIIAAASVSEIPAAWLEQLLPQGRLVAPVGNRQNQKLMMLTKGLSGKIKHKVLAKVRFVPLVSQSELAKA